MLRCLTVGVEAMIERWIQEGHFGQQPGSDIPYWKPNKAFLGQFIQELEMKN